MKKAVKRVTAVVLSGVMALGVPAVHFPNAYELKDLEVYAEGEQENEGKFLIQNGILKRYAGSEKDVVIPDNVTEIANGAFDGCNTLESITIPKGVRAAGENTTSMSVSSDGSLGVDSTFADCSKLTSIYVSEENPYYSSHDGCLYDKNGTKLIVCPAGKKQVSIPEGVKYINNTAFNYCTELTSISIPEGVESIGSCAFFGCKNLTNVSLPEGLKNIYMQIFYDCSSLANINIPKGAESIGRSTFKNCSSLESIDLPEGILSIEDETFENCSSLKSIRIPKWVQSIGKSAFKNCSSLESISIPKSVTSIKDEAFSGCDNLTIYGEKGSYAQEYAQENKIPFVAAVILEEGKNSLSEEQMSSLAEENKEEDIVIKSANGLTYVFEKGTMKLVDGKDSYDFGAEISQDYASLPNSSFAESEFAFQIDYNYEGQLPGKAKISIPVDNKWIGERLYYYKIGENGEYEYIGRSTVAADGTYTVKQEHCSSYVAAAKAPENLGDVDGEDGVTSKDALMVLKYVVEIPQENFHLELADCDGEDGVTVKDALAILKYVAEITDVFY